MAEAPGPLALSLSRWVEGSSAPLPGFHHPRGSVTLLAAVAGGLLALSPGGLTVLDLSGVDLSTAPQVGL